MYLCSSAFRHQSLLLRTKLISLSDPLVYGVYSYRSLVAWIIIWLRYPFCSRVADEMLDVATSLEFKFGWKFIHLPSTTRMMLLGLLSMEIEVKLSLNAGIGKWFEWFRLSVRSWVSAHKPECLETVIVDHYESHTGPCTNNYELIGWRIASLSMIYPWKNLQTWKRRCYKLFQTEEKGPENWDFSYWIKSI